MKKQRFNFDYIKNSNKYFIISAAIILLGILLTFILGTKLDIQFSGGTIISYLYDGAISEPDFERAAEDALGGQDVFIKTGSDFNTGKNTIRVELSSRQGLSSDRQIELTNALEDQFAANNLQIGESSDISPASGREFFLKCLVAVIFSSIVLIIYVAVRFKNIGGWLAGLCAVIALFHDILIVYATFVIFRMDIDANFMAVVLTILGYSVNDTIVIYDRIRENEILFKSKKLSIRELTNMSINQSLTRSLNTSVTTVLAMLTVTIVCMVFGVNSIISFSFPVLIGMISGTYSSICIAGPLWVRLEERKRAKGDSSKKPVKA
ncbi:MAG: protein translocase subunit SecF [Oscillospiraceae bacterium]|nr:protein translocase subunit SecF [Oscillospiraceae bacterium]